MCQFFSCIIDKRGRVYWKEGVDDHCQLIEIFNLKDDTIDPEMMTIAKIEITPFERDIFSNPKDWNFKIDEKIRPSWFCPGHEKACFEALKVCVKDINKYFVGDLDLNGYKHPLPRDFTHCRHLNLREYEYPLPESFTHCNNLNLNKYKHPLPKKFKHWSGNLDLEDYNHPLPEGFTHCGGYLYLEDYKHPLPESFMYYGDGSLYLDNYNYSLPKDFNGGNGSIFFQEYKYPLPKNLISKLKFKRGDI